VLLGVVDEYSSVLGYCWQRFLDSCEQTGMRPLDFTANTAIAGEGAAFFLLQPESLSEPSYGLIEQVEMGNLYGSKPQLPLAQPTILNCDGYPATGSVYQQQLAGLQPVASYAPLYGASPVSQAFDLAVGALALQQEELFASIDTGGDYYTDPVIGSNQPCDNLSCLRYGMAGEYAAIHLHRGDA